MNTCSTFLLGEKTLTTLLYTHKCCSAIHSEMILRISGFLNGLHLRKNLFHPVFEVIVCLNSVQKLFTPSVLDYCNNFWPPFSGWQNKYLSHMKYMPLSQSSLANSIILKRLGNALKQTKTLSRQHYVYSYLSCGRATIFTQLCLTLKLFPLPTASMAGILPDKQLKDVGSGPRIISSLP